MHTEQNQSGLTDGADHRLTFRISPLNPPAAAHAKPLGKAISYQ
jgi:hypothetical protein